MKNKQWNELSPGGGEGALLAAGIPALCAKVLAARGWTDGEAARRFLFEEAPLCDPMTMKDMDKAVGRLKAALDKIGRASCRERVWMFV